MSKIITAMAILLCLSLNVYAQVDGRAAGNVVGRMLVYVLLVVGAIFLLRKLFRKKK